MFVKLIALFERAVVALEKLAANPVDASVPVVPVASENTGTAKPRTRSKPAEEKPATPAPDQQQPPLPPADFLDDEPAKTYTKEEVRAALIAAGQRLGDSAKAQAILKEHGKVETLGQLAPEKFAAVVKAAEAAGKPAA